MSVRIFFLFCLAAAFAAHPLHAQSEARVTVVSPGIVRLNEDLKYLVELSPTKPLKDQWTKTLEPLIESFAQGLDPKQPMRVDLVLGKDLTYEMHFPLTKLEGKGGFLENLDGFGYGNKKLAAGLFDLTEGKGKNIKRVGSLREANKYASISSGKNPFPAGLAQPITPALAAFLAKGYDIAAELKNDPNDKPGMAARLANFKALREQLEAGIKFKRDEDKNVFELRKLTVVQNLNEAERFLVETELLNVFWTTDGTAKKGHGEMTFSALPDTELAKSAALLAAKPSYFANVTPPEKAAATGRVNFAVDPMRIGHFKEFYKTFRPVLAKRLGERETLKEASQKAAAKQVGDLVLDMLDAGTALDAVDGFVDLTDAGGGKHTLVCGIRAADGKVADQIVGLLPKIRSTYEIKVNIAEVGGANLHSVTVPPARLPVFQKFFAGETLVYVATSKEAVWIAIGTNAQAELTKAITAAAGPAPEKPSPVVASLSANMAKLVLMWDALQPEQPEIKGPKTAEQKQREKIRGLATQSTTGCEPWLTSELKRNGNAIEGTLDVSECALKFVGTLIADFAKTME